MTRLAPAITPIQSSAAPVMQPSVCIVSHFAYGAISGGAAGRLVGGVEWQTSLMARWLAAHGFRTTLLTWDEGQPNDDEIDGVQIRKICRRDAGAPIVRFFHPRWTGLVRAMRRADADVYYQNCGEYVTGQVALWCRRNDRGFVYSVASDPDCDPRLPEMRTLRERVLYRYGLRHADRVVVQTNRQRDMLRDGFRRDSIVIPMPCVGPADGGFDPPPPPSPGAARVVWVARILPLKRLEWLLDVAEAMPQVTFDVVGPPDPETDYTRLLAARAARICNVVLHGRVDRQRMPEFYRRASCLCCTSTYEGFPNTFLEAFSHGVPVVTTIDPDEIIARHELGAVGDNVASLVAGLKHVLASPERWSAFSTRARRYYAEHHAVEIVMPGFEALFREAAAARSRRRNSSP